MSDSADLMPSTLMDGRGLLKPYWPVRYSDGSLKRQMAVVRLVIYDTESCPRPTGMMPRKQR